MRIILAIALAAGGAFPQSAIEVPALGVIVDSSCALRRVLGVDGNFWLGPRSASGVLSAACSERLCLAKTASTILSATGETDAPPGPAIFGVNGDAAIVYFPEPRVFARWHDDILDSLDWTVNGEVLSIRLKGSTAEIAVRNDGQVSIVRPDGSVIDSIAGATGPVLLLPESLMFATSDELVVRRDDATEVRFALQGAETISSMGPHYTTIRTGDSAYAVRTEPGREALFLLPGSAP